VVLVRLGYETESHVNPRIWFDGLTVRAMAATLLFAIAAIKVSIPHILIAITIAATLVRAALKAQRP
jgi:hypothetical protein